MNRTSKITSLPNNSAVVQLEVEDAISTLRAVIDIQSGDSNNQINLKSNGVIPVAILTTKLASGETYDFDAQQINLASLTLAGAKTLDQENSGNTGVFKDVDHDGDIDLVVEFYSKQLNLDSFSTTVVLSIAFFCSPQVDRKIHAKMIFQFFYHFNLTEEIIIS
jgi:hypothetical protein